MANILGVAQSGLMAAQYGMTTTSHNIANANTPGYNRQIILQGTVLPQDVGFGFIGNGTQIASVRRVYNEFLGNQVVSSQASKSQLDSYYAQIKQINNMLADTSAGLTPALQDFFSGVQAASADPNSASTRQSMLSSAQTLASRFQSLSGQLSEMRDGVNSQLTASVGTINTYAQQLAKLNDSIEKVIASSTDKMPNDLLDQRDQLIQELSKEVQVSVVKQGNSYNVFVGNGQPLVVGVTTFNLGTMKSPTDPSRLEVGYVNNGSTMMIPESSLSGGRLGGLFDFRSQTLDVAQNSLGRVAIGLAMTFNAQHQLGQDQKGAMGGDFFLEASPVVTAGTLNTGNGALTATISDPSALTTSDYNIRYDSVSGNYSVTRLSDGAVTTFASFPHTVDGVDFDMPSGTMNSGDTFLVRPTAMGATNFGVAITDKSLIALATPIKTTTPATNTGTAKINAGSITSTTFNSGPTTLTFDGSASEFYGFPAADTIIATVNGTSTTYPPGSTVPYTPPTDMTLEFGGVKVTISGTPADGDNFTISPNTNGAGDNRNALLLGALQSMNTLDGSTASYQGAYSQLVNQVGNKTRELEVTTAAASNQFDQAVSAQQSESGVNLDEEATNLIRYQQAYQASAKVMQTASKMFDTLLSLGD